MTGSLWIGPSLGITASGGSTVQNVDRLAQRVYGPGFNGENGLLTGDGTQKTYSATFVNESGAAITDASVVLQGWYLTTSGTTSTGNTFDVTGTVEYPVGTTTTPITSGGSSTVTVPSGSHIKTDVVHLGASIPAGASYKVNLASTVPNAAKYIIRLGFAGLLTNALKSSLRKEAIYAIGDSIATNNGGSFYNAALGRCPCYQASIIGTTAQTYGASSAANFVLQSALAATMGITRFASNFGTNDIIGGRTAAQVISDIQAMRTRANAASVLFTQCTLLPRTGQLTGITPSAMTSTGTTINATVADASIFAVGKPYSITGATQTEYNGSNICTAVNTGTNVASFLFEGAAVSPATGTLLISPWKPTWFINFMTPASAGFAAGGASDRGVFNAACRSNTFDGYCEWGDSMEPTRDAGRWKVAGEDAFLPDVQTITVSSVISTSRFNSNYSAGSSTIPNGFVIPITGGNIGFAKGGNGNTNGDITVASAWSVAQQIGDQYYAVPGVSYISDDGTHPRVAAGGKGGQAILDAATVVYLTAILA